MCVPCGARFFWAVPDYVPESEVSSIADLAKPSVTERMTKLIQGIGTGAIITTVSQKEVGEYGLAPRVSKLVLVPVEK